MWKSACYLSAFLFAALASLCTLSGVFFCRIESQDDYDAVIRGDMVAGGMFALALVFFCGPRLPGAARWRYALVVASAMLIWAVVSGSLIWSHEEQDRIRSGR